jgi:hypothetical protein
LPISFWIINECLNTLFSTNFVQTYKSTGKIWPWFCVASRSVILFFSLKLSQISFKQTWNWVYLCTHFCKSKLAADKSSPSRRREAPCEGTNSPQLFTPGETKALAKSKVHRISRVWVTNNFGVLGGWSSSLISKIWRTVMNSGHWLVQFKVCIKRLHDDIEIANISWFDDW